MKIQLYAIFDTCSGLYEKPHFASSDDIVKREFQDICLADDNAISRHPEHYSLYRLANFDNTTGKTIDESNECLWTAHEAISQSQKLNDAVLPAFEKLGDEDMQGMSPAEFYKANGRLPYAADE